MSSNQLSSIKLASQPNMDLPTPENTFDFDKNNIHIIPVAVKINRDIIHNDEPQHNRSKSVI